MVPPGGSNLPSVAALVEVRFLAAATIGLRLKLASGANPPWHTGDICRNWASSAAADPADA
jgi:hypothetical protein